MYIARYVMDVLKEIFINVTAGSTRIAITDDGNLSELFIELPDHRRMVGGIYKGKVNMDVISSKNAYEGQVQLARKLYGVALKS